MKKNLKNLNTDLSVLAQDLPSQRTPTRVATESPPPKPATKRPRADPNAAPLEETAQFTLKMRESLHRELKKLAIEADMSMRGFIMAALKSKGLPATKDDLVDRRRRT